MALHVFSTAVAAWKIHRLTLPLLRHRDLDRKDFQRIEHLLRKVLRVTLMICTKLTVH